MRTNNDTTSTILNLAIIFAGGIGVRMNANSKPKQFLEHRGKPIIIYTLELFNQHPDIDGIIVACVKDWIPVLNDLIEKYNLSKVVKVVPGGESGQESIFNALSAAEAFAEGRKAIALVHDGVRPFISEQVISDNIEGVHRFGNCITCVPAIETFIIHRGDNEYDIPNREDVMVARAPQSFYLDDILNAHRQAKGEKRHFIDCCSMMTFYGHQIHTIIGPMENIKITTPMDYYVFKTFIDIREHRQSAEL